MNLGNGNGDAFPAPAEGGTVVDAGDRFEAAWHAATRPEDIRSHLPPPGDARRPAVLLELAVRDLELRLVHGLPARVEDYLACFPELADDRRPVLELIEAELALRRLHEPTFDGREYRERFPALADELTTRPGGEPVPPGYELLGEIGRGGMGIVYKARQKSLGRVVALKMLRAEEGAGNGQHNRFDREARAVAGLHHPHIVQVYDTGQVGGRPFLALEFVEEGSLADRLDGTPWPSRAAASLVATLARAVQHAHERGVVHRDLKPSNVLLAGPPEACTPKVTDFGLAKRLDTADDTGTGVVVGTPSYMAPEQAEGNGRAIDARTDVYGLGAILYELLTGRPPFRAESAVQTLRQVVEAEPARPRALNPAVPRDLETVCLKCLEKEPHRRYASALDLADDLGRWLRGEPVQARRVGAVGRTWRWCRRKPLTATLVAALALALLGFVASRQYQLRQTEAARREADLALREARDNQAQFERLLNELLVFSADAAPAKLRLVRAPDVGVLLGAEAHVTGLLQQRPGDTGLRIILTNVHGTLAWLYERQGQIAEAAAHYRSAGDLWEDLAHQDPGNRLYRDWLATTCRWQAAAARAQAQFGQSVGLLLRAHALWEELAEEQPDSPALLRKVALARVSLLALTELGTGREAALRVLQAEKEGVSRLLEAHPTRAVLRKRLALACLVLGQVSLVKPTPPEAVPVLQQAHTLYQDLARQTPDPLVHLNLALCCCGLMAEQPADPFYAEAVARLEPAGRRLTALEQQDPDGDWVRPALLETYCSLAACHWRAGQAELAEQTFRDRVRPLVEAISRHPANPGRGMNWVSYLLNAAEQVRSKEAAAALALVQEAATLAERYAEAPARDLGLCDWLAVNSADVSAFLCRLGDPARALRLAEQAHALAAGLRRAAPAEPRYGHFLGSAWERIAKARWELGRRDQALDAFREAAAVQRQVFEQAPSVPLHREILSRCYDKLAYYGGQRGDRATAAAALLEREKLWPNDPKRLCDVAEDFQKLAEAVGDDEQDLSAEEQAERERYLAASERARQAAAAHR